MTGGSNRKNGHRTRTTKTTATEAERRYTNGYDNSLQKRISNIFENLLAQLYLPVYSIFFRPPIR